LIDKRQENLPTTPNHIYLDLYIDLASLSKELKVEMTVKWQDGKQQFTTFMEKGEMYCAEKIRTILLVNLCRVVGTKTPNSLW
jgi:hypothetical protein